MARLVGCVLLLRLVGAERFFGKKEADAEWTPLLATQGVMCGTSKIKDALKLGAQNLPWDTILRTADDYVAAQNLELQALLAKVSSAKAALERALLAEAVPDRSSDQAKLTELMEPVFGVYESREMLQASRCGAQRVSVGNEKKRFSGLYDSAVESFQNNMEAVLQTEGFTMNNGDATEQACLDIIAVDGEDACKHLCSQIAVIARSSTNAVSLRSSGGVSSKDIQAELEQLSGTFQTATSLKNDCANAKEELMEFKTHLEAFDRDMAEHRAIFVAAGSQLREATFDLEDLEENARAHGLELERLQQVLAQTELVQASIASDLQSLQDQASDVEQGITRHTISLKQVSRDIEAAQEASSTTQEFKQKLTNLLLQMVMAFDEAVRKPLEVLGLGAGVDIELKFPVAAVEAVQQNTASAIADMMGFCGEDSTKAAFSKADHAVKAARTWDDKVDGEAKFGELCQISEVSSVAQSLHDVVKQRVAAIVKELRNAQSWTDPFKGQKKIDDPAALGEIDGLRKVISIYNSAPFYKNYLKKWKHTETFHRYYAVLGLALQQSQETQARLMAELSEFQGQLQALMAQIDEMQDKLDAALAAAAAAGKDVSEAQRIAQQLSGAQDAMRANIAQLQVNAAEAQKGVQNAKETLEAAYGEATALMQLLSY